VAERRRARLELDFGAPPELLERLGARPEWIARVVEATLDHLDAGRPLLSIALVDDRQSGEFHALSHGDPEPTDVISVELGSGPGPLGEVVVNAQLAERIAGERGVAPARELALYLVHGLLHLFGHDDQDEAGRAAMRRAERAVLDRLGFAPDLLPHDR
jgi:probable rRNA maturation factor